MGSRDVHKRFVQVGYILLLIIFTYWFFPGYFTIADTETSQKVAKDRDRSRDCDILVISCIDFRFVSFIRNFLTDNLKIKDDYDHIAVPGSVINIIKPETQKITLDEIDISLHLHHVNRLVL